MSRMKLITVQVHPPNVGDLVSAALARDSAAVGRVLDASIELRGPVGSVLENVDAVAWDAVAQLLIENLPALSVELADRCPDVRRRVRDRLRLRDGAGRGD